jgi:hypothetical protein
MYVMNRIIVVLFIVIIGCKSKDIDLAYFDDSQRAILTDLMETNEIEIRNHYRNYKSKVNVLFSDYLNQINDADDLHVVSSSVFLRDEMILEELYKEGLLVKNVDVRGEFSLEKEGFDINPDGPYIEFLESKAQDSDPIEKYYNRTILDGGISPILTKLVLSSFSKNDLKDENLRLIISIHFLILNQQNIRLQSFDNRNSGSDVINQCFNNQGDLDYTSK